MIRRLRNRLALALWAAAMALWPLDHSTEDMLARRCGKLRVWLAEVCYEAGRRVWPAG